MESNAKKSGQGLPRRDNRWKWMVAATAVGAVGAAAPADASTIVLNQVWNGPTNTLNADLTGDSIADITIGSVSNISRGGALGFRDWIQAKIAGVLVTASGHQAYRIQGFRGYVYTSQGGKTQATTFHSYFAPRAHAKIGASSANVGYGYGPNHVVGNAQATLSQLIPIIFSDSALSYGPTPGLLTVRAIGRASGNPFVHSEIDIVQLDYEANQAPSDVPEPSSLALMATGAVGLAYLRKRRHAN